MAAPADRTQANITVSNVRPVLVVGRQTRSVDEGAAARSLRRSAHRRSALFVDDGILDTHTATVDWGDGSAVEAPTVFRGQWLWRARRHAHLRRQRRLHRDGHRHRRRRRLRHAAILGHRRQCRAHGGALEQRPGRRRFVGHGFVHQSVRPQHFRHHGRFPLRLRRRQ